ncbi:RIP metalloprotease RseP [Pseudomonas sp. S 311-6]|uniref:Zinc metalloprotease n=1 Tax=Kerstersia gyiorum TaxID=206506 RepID=A0A171KQU4_9BURK|nr:RIP metalloprotease RseP [Kerstersia gyiorum]AZV93751.1 RIP metalloprotease RseP [Bordetella sp. J329]MCO7640979.1 RIP metalloprotease RseP [Pseudomonas sp. S 311-6]KAB0543181.1 RIP metalloprotease RseP [Kerstersia gyiorum]KKO71261.1 membrane protein [Kerstersia gyiorum]MCP1711491.1 regulator of sigma E protease [Kerstersia gyiorum]
MLYTLITFLVALGILVTIHELGHYSVARFFNVRILRFSVGFGRVLWQKRDARGTEWAVSMIPLGGYVKMADDGLGGDVGIGSGKGVPFNRLNVYRRIAVVLAGPVCNLLLAAVLYAILGMMGSREPQPVLADPQEGSAAALAGVASGDRIQAIDGRKVETWSDARWLLLDKLTAGGTLRMDVTDRAGQPRQRLLVLQGDRLEHDADPLVGAGLALQAANPYIRSVISGGAGEAAGLKDGDKVLRAGSQESPDVPRLLAEIQAHGGQPLELRVRRGNTELDLTLVPAEARLEDGRVVGRIGAQLAADLPMVDRRYGPLEAISHGVVRTWETSLFTLRMMGRMLTGTVSWRNINGPVAIADYAGQSARVGLDAYIGFLALLSVSLGVLNLLPIPTLDGGHLLYYFAEIVRGRPLPDNWLEIGQRFGMILLAALMGLALFNDIGRIVTRLFS